MQALQKIKRTSNSKILSVYASHQVFPELKDTIDSIDILALPVHVIDHQVSLELSKPNLRLIPVVTGDSTSMVTEIADSLVGKALYVINAESMNASHEAHVQSVNQAGYAHLVNLVEDQQYKVMPAAKVQSHNRESAADAIVKEINHYLVQKTRSLLLQKNQAKTFELGIKYVSTAGLLFTHHKASEVKDISFNKLKFSQR